MHINLLSHDIRAKIEARRILRQWTLIWVIAGLATLAGCIWQARELRAAQARLALLNSRCESLRELQRELGVGRQHYDDRHSELTALERIEPQQHVIDLLGVLVQAMRPQAGQLQIQRLNVVLQRPNVDQVSSRPREQRGTVVAATTPHSLLNLQGVADDDNVLSRFVTDLRQAGVFERVDLKSSTRLIGSQHSLRQYQLECRYEDQP